jgi:hypothetical protein
MIYWGPPKEVPPAPPEERFAPLFKAARVLIREGISAENQIFPTLALANAIGYDLDLATLKDRIVSEWGNWEAREALARDLTQRCNGGLWPVRVEDEVLLVEQAPATARIEPYQGTEIPEQVRLIVFPHRAPKNNPWEEHAADCAAARYEETLSTAGFPHNNGSGEGLMDAYFEDGVVHVTVRHCQWPMSVEHASIVFRDSKPPFPSPVLVRESCLVYVKGSSWLLKPRKRGRDHDPGNLIPGCVAAVLKAVHKGDGGLEWPAVRQLLNQQKIYEPHRGPFPENEVEKGPKAFDSRRKALARSRHAAYPRMLATASILQNPL